MFQMLPSRSLVYCRMDLFVKSFLKTIPKITRPAQKNLGIYWHSRKSDANNKMSFGYDLSPLYRSSVTLPSFL